MLNKQNDPETQRPIPQKRKEIIQNGFERVAAAEGEREGDDGEEDAPEEAGDGDEVLAPELDGEGGGVDVADEVAYCGKGLVWWVRRGGRERRGGGGGGKTVQDS